MVEKSTAQKLTSLLGKRPAATSLNEAIDLDEQPKLENPETVTIYKSDLEQKPLPTILWYRLVDDPEPRSINLPTVPSIHNIKQLIIDKEIIHIGQ